MPKRIRIGGLSVTTTDTSLASAFSAFGPIVAHSIDRDAAGGSLGVGHVEYATDAAGTTAIQTMNNATLEGATIAVSPERA